MGTNAWCPTLDAHCRLPPIEPCCYPHPRLSKFDMPGLQLLPLDKAFEQEVHLRFLVQEDVVVDHGLSDICFRRTPYRHWEVDETQAPDR